MKPYLLSFFFFWGGGGGGGRTAICLLWTAGRQDPYLPLKAITAVLQLYLAICKSMQDSENVWEF